ncbi:MAG: heat shock protein GrpE [Candidatus Bathyarchaeota archaeon BA1]|nr:MAG: heat shock protein GrpE [Candidatus Bathyarchaeota archaeon BA1]
MSSDESRLFQSKGDDKLSEKEKPKQGKPRISKLRELEETLRAERERSSEYLSRLMYLQADFENYRKRMEKEIREAAHLGNEKLIVNLLGVIDELEMAIQSGKKTENKEALLKGVEMVLKKIYITLGQEGLTEIEAVGKPFDPSKHEAIFKVPTNDYAEGTVIEEVRKGFMLRDKVIRPSMVKVALAPITQNKSDPKESV